MSLTGSKNPITPISGGRQALIFSSGSAIGTSVFSIFGRSNYETSEALVDFIVGRRITFLSIAMSVGTNGKSGTSLFHLRKNGVDIPESQIAVPPATTGNFSITMIASDAFFDEGDTMSIHFEGIGGGQISNITYVAVAQL